MIWGKNCCQAVGIIPRLYKPQKTFAGQWYSPFEKVAGLNTGTAPLEISTGETLVRPWTPTALLGTHPITHHLKLACWQQHDTLINIRCWRCICGFHGAPSRLFCSESLSRIAMVAGQWSVSNHWYSPRWPEQNPKPRLQLNPQQSIFFIGLSMSSIRWVTPTSPRVSPGGGRSPSSTVEQSMPDGGWSLMKSPV